MRSRLSWRAGGLPLRDGIILRQLYTYAVSSTWTQLVGGGTPVERAWLGA